MHTSRPRAAFTLMELLVAMVLTLVVFGATIPFFRVQLRGVGKEAGRLDAQQNVRFALSSIERELRVAGGGVVAQQPMIVQAAPNAITFNVDLVTNSSDPSAVYADPDAPNAVTTSLTQQQKIPLPITGRQYPDTTYWQSAGVPSAAQTISYWAAPDPQNSGQYILYRRVNNTDSTIVSSGIILPSGQPLFRYYALDSLGNTIEISQSNLPIIHIAPIHGSKADTGSSSLTDQIRVVRVSLTGVSIDPDTHQPVQRNLTGDVRLLNAGLVQNPMCGQPPIPVSSLSPTVFSDSDSVSVTLSWSASPDESGGEKDIERYLLYRWPAGGAQSGGAYATIAAGLGSYNYTDANVHHGDHWIYGVAAEDCTPTLSNLTTADPGKIP